METLRQPTTGYQGPGIGRRATVAIILAVLLAAVAVHSVDGGPSAFMPGGATASLLPLAVGQQP